MRGGSPRALARIGAGVAALGLVVLSASPAFATTGRIESLPTLPNGDLGIVFSAVGLAPGQTIDLTTVKVSINGQPAVSKASFVADTAAQPLRQTMLTIDVSGSMANVIGTSSTTRIDAAKQAANAFLSGVPKDVYVGIVTFADAAKVALAPTQDHAKVKQVINGLAATNGNTALFDAVVAANGGLDPKAIANQLLLTDGANDRGTNTLATAAANVKASKVVLDAVSIGADATGVQQLTALTTAGNGSTVSADNANQLTDIFTSAATDQANQVIIDVTVPANLAGTSQNVGVAASAGGQTIADARVAIMPAAVTGVPTSAAESYGPVPVETPSAGITGQSWFLPVAVAAVGLGLFGLLAIALVSTDRENQTTGRVRRRLSRYSLTSRQEKQSTVATSGALGQSQVARSAVELAGRVTQNRDVDTLLGAKLEAAGVPLKPPEWMIIHLGIAIVAALVMALLTGFGLLATLMGLGLGLLLPFVYLSMKEGRRKSEFAAQLPSTLQLLSGSLAAGYSLPQGVDTVVRESSGPMAAELNRAIVEARLGVPMEDALEAVARRMDSVDFAWVVMAIRIQREVGGNLAEVLSSVAATMRERERLRRQVEVLSAEGRLSAIILGALPLLFVLYLVLVRPEYIGVLITNPLGIAMIVVGVVLLIAGGFWLRKVVTVEV